MSYKAALIGLGQIAYTFDDGSNEGVSSLSHYAAYTENPDIRVVGGYSPLDKEAKDFQNNTGVMATTELSELLSLKPDLISICSPTNKHAEQLELLVRSQIPMIWLEKPAAESSEDIVNIIDLSRDIESKSTILVNFFRRYHQSYKKLKELIASKYFGDVKAVNISYSRGLLNNGVHMLDLIFFLFPDTKYRIEWVGIDDSDNPSFIIEFGNSVRIFVQGTETDYHNIDIVVTFSKGRVPVIHGGMTTSLEEEISHELFPDYSRLSFASDNIIGEGGFNRSFDEALMDLIESHEKSTPPLSNLESSLKSHKLVEEIFSFN